MHTAHPSHDIITESEQPHPGVCRGLASQPPSIGWYVPYRLQSNDEPFWGDCFEAAIMLLVQDTPLAPTISHVYHIPFVIDSGSPVTIIPRRLVLEPYGFPIETAVDPVEHSLRVGGEQLNGRLFRAQLSIVGPEHAADHFSFSPITPFVAEMWSSEEAILGQDALRQLVIVSDDEHMSFWRLPQQRKEATR